MLILRASCGNNYEQDAVLSSPGPTNKHLGRAGMDPFSPFHKSMTLNVVNPWGTVVSLFGVRDIWVSPLSYPEEP